MLKKEQFLEIIDKYHLNGVIEKVGWNIKDNNLTIDFISPNQDMIGKLRCPFESADVSLGIYDTSKLIKLISILDKELLLSIEKERDIPTKLKIEDTNYTLFYSLADTSIISSVPNVKEPQYEITFKVNSTSAKLFEKAKNALGSDIKEVFTIQSFYKDESPQVKLVLGELNSHSNKIEFFIESNFEGVPSNPIMFSSLYFKEILNANKDKEGVCYLSEQGLMKVDFGDVLYYLTQLDQ